MIVDFDTNPATGVPGRDAAVKEINACGGIKGHPIEVDVCSSMGVAATATKCARDASQDSSVIALAGGASSFGANIDPFLASGKLASVQLLGTAPDFVSPYVFATNVGNLNSLAQAAYAVTKLKAKKVGVPYLNIGLGKQVPVSLYQAVLKPAGLSAPIAVPIELTETNFPAKAAALKGADAVVPGLTGDLIIQLVSEMRSAGIDAPVIANTTILTPGQIKKGLPNPGTIYLSSPFKLSGTGYAAYQKAIAAVGKAGTEFDNTAALGVYDEIKLVVNVANKLSGTPTRAAMLQALSTLTNYDNGGLTPPLTFANKGSVNPAFKNLVNPDTVTYKYSDGKLVPAGNGEFEDYLSAK